MDMFLLHRHIKRSLFVLIYTDVLLVINCILKYVSEFNYVLLIYFVLNMLKSLLWILAKTKMNWCTLGAHQVQALRVSCHIIFLIIILVKLAMIAT